MRMTDSESKLPDDVAVCVCGEGDLCAPASECSGQQPKMSSHEPRTTITQDDDFCPDCVVTLDRGHGLCADCEPEPPYSEQQGDELARSIAEHESDCENCDGVRCMHMVMRDWHEGSGIDECDGWCCPSCGPEPSCKSEDEDHAFAQLGQGTLEPQACCDGKDPDCHDHLLEPVEHVYIEGDLADLGGVSLYEPDFIDEVIAKRPNVGRLLDNIERPIVTEPAEALPPEVFNECLECGARCYCAQSELEHEADCRTALADETPLENV